ncbi:MAG: MBL fold metallo-hydrolase [Chloroflexota bacterium]|nr:MBL fold metallo-hydrolase [Chloroflexota bacterium]
MDLHPVVPGIYALPGMKTGRSYLIEDARGLALVDTSTQGCAARILEAIDALRRPARELHTIVATHYHLDHTGNVAALRERTGARLYVHAADAPYVDGRTPWMAMRGPLGGLAARFGPRPYSISVDGELHDGDVVPIAGGLTVVHLPGHTPGNIGLYSRERGLVFTGDALMNVFGLRTPLDMSTHDPAQARDSVRKLATLDFEIALPGHGAPIIGRASEKIRGWTERW